MAIKVLPSLYAADAGRLRRFEQEARVSGALTHPNLLTEDNGERNEELDQWLPVAGHFFGALFFLLVFLAGITSAIALLEIVSGSVAERAGWTRARAVWTTAAALIVLQVPVILSQGPWADVRIGGRDLFGLIDFVSARPPASARRAVAPARRRSDRRARPASARGPSPGSGPAEPGLTAGTLVTLPIDDAVHPLTQRNYDVTPDGKQLLIVLPAQTAPSDSGCVGRSD